MPKDLRSEELVEVRQHAALDWGKVERYLRRQLEHLDGPFDVRQFPNGSANLTYRLQFGDTYLVLRRPPSGKLAPGSHDMRREFTTLSQLWRCYDRAPRAFLFCDDHQVAGADFFVMEYRAGVVMWETLPESMAALPNAGRRMGFAVVDALAELHAVVPGDCNLERPGRPRGFVRRQLDGWARRWELVSSETLDARMRRVSSLLEQRCPESSQVAIVHNDFKVNNCQFQGGEPDIVRSVFDWDMATLGDPLIDLGTLVNYWPDPLDTPGDRGIYVDGFERQGLPTHGEVIERYRACTGFDTSELSWYVAFGAYRTAVALQQLHARYLRGETSDERMSTRGERVGELALRAERLLCSQQDGQIGRMTEGADPR
jgi:aminoglycoside phosphotransferase (APT) family kinase protein